MLFWIVIQFPSNNSRQQPSTRFRFDSLRYQPTSAFMFSINADRLDVYNLLHLCEKCFRNAEIPARNKTLESCYSLRQLNPLLYFQLVTIFLITSCLFCLCSLLKTRLHGTIYFQILFCQVVFVLGASRNIKRSDFEIFIVKFVKANNVQLRKQIAQEFIWMHIYHSRVLVSLRLLLENGTKRVSLEARESKMTF